MSIVDRINARLMRTIRERQPAVTVEGDAVVVTGAGAERRYTFGTLTRVTGWQRDVFAGAVMTLRLEFPGGAVEIGEADPAWDAIVAALDASGRIDPSHQWKLALMARGIDAEPIVLT